MPVLCVDVHRFSHSLVGIWVSCGGQFVYRVVVCEAHFGLMSIRCVLIALIIATLITPYPRIFPVPVLSNWAVKVSRQLVV